MRNLMPTLGNSPYNSLEIFFSYFGEKIAWRVQKTAFQAPLKACAFGARQRLQCWPFTLTTQPSTSKLSDNPGTGIKL